MNMIMLSSTDFIDTNTVRISGRRLEHILSIHKAKEQDKMRVGLLNDKMGHGLITQITNNYIELKITLDTPPPKPLPITLILALPRPKSLQKVLHSVTELGIKKIILLHTKRVEKSYWQSKILKPEALSKIMTLGLEQARDTIMPQIIMKKRFKWFIEDDLHDVTKNTLPFIAHPDAEKECPRELSKPLTLAIGPEGGFIPYEVDSFCSNGFAGFTLGSRILRVETAVPSIISKIF